MHSTGARRPGLFVVVVVVDIFAAGARNDRRLFWRPRSGLKDEFEGARVADAMKGLRAKRRAKDGREGLMIRRRAGRGERPF
ncbi:hypothetical protein BCR34DRAFT_579589 [Clohesyomyces aquaticus]|uniref:Uncharacterized protein n=1 Tax=Clohesyomyces aquaticus TaxID=1231657 RepID=A0A1Y1YAQ4_9PLEO|nr:hypothetical protein BCR34DRAFT_579589 [Clohesyomyces aquaticus]